MLDIDRDFGNNVTFVALLMLGTFAMIAIIVLGVVALHSWEAESLLHCSPWSTLSSPCGHF
jgi:hypothetical protein